MIVVTVPIMTNAVQAYAYAGPSTLTAGRLALSTSGPVPGAVCLPGPARPW